MTGGISMDLSSGLECLHSLPLYALHSQLTHYVSAVILIVVVKQKYTSSHDEVYQKYFSMNNNAINETYCFTTVSHSWFRTYVHSILTSVELRSLVKVLRVSAFLIRHICHEISITCCGCR